MVKDQTKYPKLPPIFKKKWVAALRSREYKQGTGSLASEEEDEQGEGNGKYKYCCLGVACMVAGVGLDNIADEGVIDINTLKNNPRIPKIIKGGVEENEVVGKLMRMNDSENKKFYQIADWIDKNL